MGRCCVFVNGNIEEGQMWGSFEIVISDAVYCGSFVSALPPPNLSYSAWPGINADAKADANGAVFYSVLMLHIILTGAVCGPRKMA